MKDEVVVLSEEEEEEEEEEAPSQRQCRLCALLNPARPRLLDAADPAALAHHASIHAHQAKAPHRLTLSRCFPDWRPSPQLLLQLCGPEDKSSKALLPPPPANTQPSSLQTLPSHSQALEAREEMEVEEDSEEETRPAKARPDSPLPPSGDPRLQSWAAALELRRKEWAGSGPQPCQQCGAVAASGRPSDVEAHVSGHFGRVLFACAGCSDAFRDRAAARAHAASCPEASLGMSAKFPDLLNLLAACFPEGEAEEEEAPSLHSRPVSPSTLSRVSATSATFLHHNPYLPLPPQPMGQQTFPGGQFMPPQFAVPGPPGMGMYGQLPPAPYYGHPQMSPYPPQPPPAHPQGYGLPQPPLHGYPPPHLRPYPPQTPSVRRH